jgi:hypothetical protein
MRILDAFVTVTMAWVVLACDRRDPVSGHWPAERPRSGLFESLSGFTTTGATVLRPVATPRRVC